MGIRLYLAQRNLQTTIPTALVFLNHLYFYIKYTLCGMDINRRDQAVIVVSSGKEAGPGGNQEGILGFAPLIYTFTSKVSKVLSLKKEKGDRVCVSTTKTHGAGHRCPYAPYTASTPSSLQGHHAVGSSQLQE